MPNLSNTDLSLKKNKNIIAPISWKIQQDVIKHTYHYIQIGSQLFNKKFDLIPVLFNLSGRSAGMYRWKSLTVNKKDKLGIIRYNPWIFAKHYEENFMTTVPHEVSHYLARCIYGKKLRPHGKEWKSIMQHFGANNAVTVDFDMKGIPARRSRKFIYHCSCMTHQLGIRRHNKCSNNQASYFCTKCYAKLNFSMEC
jgi:SprT protein